MTADTVESETGPGILEGKLVVVKSHAVKKLSPEPAIFRSLGIFEHDGPVGGLLAGRGVIGCGGSVLLFDDHGTVGNGALAAGSSEPLHDFRGVINFHGRVGAVVDASAIRSGVTYFFIEAPFQILVRALLEKT